MEWGIELQIPSNYPPSCSLTDNSLLHLCVLSRFKLPKASILIIQSCMVVKQQSASFWQRLLNFHIQLQWSNPPVESADGLQPASNNQHQIFLIIQTTGAVTTDRLQYWMKENHGWWIQTPSLSQHSSYSPHRKTLYQQLDKWQTELKDVLERRLLWWVAMLVAKSPIAKVEGFVSWGCTL